MNKIIEKVKKRAEELTKKAEGGLASLPPELKMPNSIGNSFEELLTTLQNKLDLLQVDVDLLDGQINAAEKLKDERETLISDIEALIDDIKSAKETEEILIV